MSNAAVPTWASDREVHPTVEQLSWVDALAQSDAEFSHPSDGSPIATETLRITPRRLVRGVQRRVSARLPRTSVAVKKLSRRAARETGKLGRRLRPQRLPEQLSINGVDVSVVDLASDSAALQLSRITSNLVVLVRSANRVTTKELQLFANEIAQHPDADFWYSDSISPQGFRIYRPAPSHLLTEQCDWFGAVVAVRTDCLDVALSDGLTSVEDIIRNIALHTPESRSLHLNFVAGVAPFIESLQERPTRMVADGPQSPLVSIIIPTCGTSGQVNGVERTFVVEAVRSALERTTYPQYEFVIVADDPTPQTVIHELELIAGDRLRLVRWSSPFNFSEKMNLGAAVARGEYLLMLNDDIEVASPNWLSELVALVERDEFEVSGALLFFEDLTLQHAGHLYRGGAGHVGFGRPLTPRDPNTYLHLDREVSGVTGACLLLRRSLFAEVGGFSPIFPGNYNDVDLCLKVRSKGGRIACSGAARLYHFESKSRDATVKPSDLEHIHARWGDELDVDPFWPSPD